RGARLTGAPWMALMAERMEERGADRTVAREMYRRMYEQASDPLVKRWAVGRLVYLRWLDEQDAVRRVLAEHRGRAGACPAGWAAVALALQAAGLRTAPDGSPVDPTGVPYVLVHDGAACDVALGPGSEVPAS
ncbi:MAG TPA: hypothetical protein VFX28_17725, partial [Methylomirabilota bacterium]|nr:hypothetical protein [Methylomirabilota bacterium]